MRVSTLILLSLFEGTSWAFNHHAYGNGGPGFPFPHKNAGHGPSDGQECSFGSYKGKVDVLGSSFSISNSKGQDVWTTSTERAFISASSGLANQTDSSGNFEIRSDNISAPCKSPQMQAYRTAPELLVIDGNFADGACSALSWSISFSSSSKDGEGLVFDATIIGGNVDNIYLAFESPKEEAFFGLGEQAGIGNLRGYRIPFWTREGGVGRGEEPVTSYLNSNRSISGTFAGGSALTSYTAIASYATSIGRYFVLNGWNYALFDLASGKTDPFTDTAETELSGEIAAGDKSDTSTTVIEVMYEGSTMSGTVGCKDAMLDAITSLTQVSGRQPALPDWAFDGAVLGIQGGQEKVERIIQTSLHYGMPLVGVWLQDWSGTRLQAGMYNISLSRLWWNWEPDMTLYPTWADWVPHLLDTYQVRTMSYVNTFLANVTNKPTGFNRNFFLEATESGRFVQNATANDGSTWTITSGPGIDAGLLDISNTTTVAWFKDLIKTQFYSVPIKGMMQDFGEYLAVDSSVALTNGQGITPREFHNEYPGAWARLLREVTEELGLGDDSIGFHRSANTFSAAHTNLFWVGDQDINFSRLDGMRAVISSSIHVGVSGFGQAHSDVGGYTNTLAPTFNITRTPPLLGRWGEMAALSAATFRTHEGNIPSVNTQVYSNETTYLYHTYNARMYAVLKPYRKMAIQEYQEKGWPLVRHPIVYAGGDVAASKIIDESYFFGGAMLVAPVYDPAEQTLDVYLPDIGPGYVYTHVWSGETFYGGSNVTVDAPYGKPGVFLRTPLSAEETEALSGFMEFVEQEKGATLSVA
ncbi:glycoside hydrolase family 31 protein [Aulographum hederae CBS 113979]|uniref:Glycoside hydrolase family 31 protein n=1 Tax=Aulographum hederae CBS 113979 TaxID=1176131 RepID=A0A6G1H683_9PEZI|nr:glycoside hydrolase family 31 protein [Aulographum hederae CBS 113979]